MEFTDLGDSGIRVSRIALGTWSIGGWMWGGTEERQALETLHAAFDRGITTVDTAPIYGFGTSEERVGRAVDRLDELARERWGKRVIHLAVRWLLDRGVGVALWGARKPEQLGAVDDVLGWRIDPAGMEQVDRILEETIRDPVGPEFMAPPE